MTGQTELLQRLMDLLMEVDTLKGEDHREERLSASQRVERELDAIEAEVAVDVSTAAGKQQAGLLALVRSALQNDRDNASFEDWSEDGLLKEHGLTTYATQAYWDEAYSDKKYGDSFDWYGRWEERDVEGRSLGSLLRPIFAKSVHVLVLGCGNSNMSVLMHQEGYENIVNVDISEPVIEQMQKRHGHLKGMSWHAMDAAALKFADGEFDAAIEKGLFDALFAGTGSQVQAVLAEVQRILRPGGRFVSVSFAKDRLERLFTFIQEGSGGQEQANEAVGPALSCEVAGTLHYAKEDERRTSDLGNGAGSKAFYVYLCKRLP